MYSFFITQEDELDVLSNMSAIRDTTQQVLYHKDIEITGMHLLWSHSSAFESDLMNRNFKALANRQFRQIYYETGELIELI